MSCSILCPINLEDACLTPVGRIPEQLSEGFDPLVWWMALIVFIQELHKLLTIG